MQPVHDGVSKTNRSPATLVDTLGRQAPPVQHMQPEVPSKESFEKTLPKDSWFEGPDEMRFLYSLL